MPDDQRRVYLNVKVAPATPDKLHALAADSQQSMGLIVDALVESAFFDKKTGRSV